MFSIFYTGIFEGYLRDFLNYLLLDGYIDIEL